jgi:hypothetical protein
MRIRTKDVVAAAIGAAAAVATDRSSRTVLPGRRTEAAAAGLIGAAVIYPLARRRTFGYDVALAALLVRA